MGHSLELLRGHDSNAIPHIDLPKRRMQLKTGDKQGHSARPRDLAKLPGSEAKAGQDIGADSSSLALVGSGNTAASGFSTH